MSVNAILQARLSSTRLPGKVLHKIMNKPMIMLQIERIKLAKSIDKIIVATSIKEDDDAIEDLCNALNISCFRGDLNDVLDRFYCASKAFPSDHIVRLTGDCPLIDPEIIDHVISLHLKQKIDYTSNCCPPSLPDGLDVEIFTIEALTKSWRQARKSSEREHVTQYILNNRDQFDVANYKHSQDLSLHRWTVDEKSDFELVEKIYQLLYPHNERFTLNDVLALLKKQPELSKINNHFSRNQGLTNSKAIDKESKIE